MNDAKERIITLIHDECSKLQSMDAFQLLQDVIEDCQNEADVCIRMEYMEDFSDENDV